MIRWVFVLLALAWLVPTQAIVLCSGGTVIIDEGQIINDDLVVTGGTLEMRGEVTGDLVAAGGNITVSGLVQGNVIAAGGNVTITQPVGGSLYVTGGNVQLSSMVARNAAVTSGTLRMEPGASVGRDLAAASGDVTVAGAVARDLIVSTGTLTLTDAARIGRNVTGTAATQRIAAGAVIAGQNTVAQPPARQARGAGWLVWFLWRLIMGIGLLLLGLVFVALAPRLTAQTVGVIRAHPWASLLTGFITLIVVPIAAFILFVLILTIPISLVLSALYFSAVFLSPIFPAILVGLLILRRRNGGDLYVPLLIGMAIYLVVRFIPLLGGLVAFVAVLLGLGALVLALQARTRRPIYPVTTE